MKNLGVILKSGNINYHRQFIGLHLRLLPSYRQLQAAGGLLELRFAQIGLAGLSTLIAELTQGRKRI